MTRIDCALVLLASGDATRFQNGDKLLSPLADAPLIDRAATLFQTTSVIGRFAVVSPDQTARQEILKRRGWTILENPRAKEGQSAAVQIGAAAAARIGAGAVLFALADMPFVSDEHLLRLIEAAQSVDAVMCQTPRGMSPPALFHRRLFGALSNLSGDKGARAIFQARDNTATIDLSTEHAFDVDTQDDLDRANAIFRNLKTLS